MSFIETSALDASNVESAFQNILTGIAPAPFDPAHELTTVLTADIYRIVSNKALEQNENQIKPPGESITVTPSVDGPSQNGKAGCC